MAVIGDRHLAARIEHDQAAVAEEAERLVIGDESTLFAGRQVEDVLAEELGVVAPAEATEQRRRDVDLRHQAVDALRSQVRRRIEQHRDAVFVDRDFAGAARARAVVGGDDEFGCNSTVDDALEISEQTEI